MPRHATSSPLTEGGGPSMASIAFNVEGWTCGQPGDDETFRFWETPEGDRIGVRLNWGADAFPPGLGSLADLRRHWDERLHQVQGSVVEVALTILAGGPVYRIEYKVKQDRPGFSYSAAVKKLRKSCLSDDMVRIKTCPLYFREASIASCPPPR